MSAKGHGNRIEMIVDIVEFYDRVGIVGSYKELAWLGFELDNFGGIFRSKDHPQLLRFCEENPEYHVVTCTEPGRFVNHYVPNQRLYKLAKGDSYPHIPVLRCRYRVSGIFRDTWGPRCRSILG